MIEGNVIRFNPADFYCARQCQESIKWCSSQKNPMYDLEIKQEKALYKTFVDSILGRA